MAEYITADRWLTGVATHKTKHGRILCTGVGCVGCFPDDFPKLARELEVYDNKTAMLFGESWDDRSNDEEALETGSGESRERERCAREEIKGSTESNEKISEAEKKRNSLNFDVPTAGESSDIERCFLTECIQQSDGDGVSRSGVIAGSSAEDDPRDEIGDTEATVSTKYSLETNGLLSRTQRGDRKNVFREDCVCLFFALEYYRRARKLPEFSILEIVDALNTSMHINEIKCVQHLNGMWHIVLRTREQLRHLLKHGLIIRGRCFQIVQDNDMYCDKV